LPVIDIEIEDDVFLECYHHLVHDEDIYDIDFLYGGRDSGKSRHIAMQLVVSCINEEYFKCLLIRKQLNTVRASQFDLIKSVIDEWGLTNFFHFNETRLEIICKANGNGFYGRGLDDAGKIKSFNNPSCCWVEEGNQITQDDFTILQTSLRANNVRIKVWFSFNPECEGNYTEFWLYQEYFEAMQPQLSFTWTKLIEIPGEGPVPMRIRATHTTYKDNPYCSAQRRALYESYAKSKNNKYWYQTYTLGLWGFRLSGDNFYKCFNEDVHANKIIPSRKEPLHITLDNNVSPYIALGIWQLDMKNKILDQIDEIPCASPDNTAAKAAKKFLAWRDRQGYDMNDLVFVYGDPSANKKSTEDDEGRSFFDKFFNVLTLAGVKFVNRVGRAAPGVAISGAFVNEIYESGYEGWQIRISANCRKSIEDYTMTKEDKDGTVLKKREKNKDTGQVFERYGHFSDNKRYLVTTVLHSEYQKFSAKRSKFYGY